MSTHPAKKRTRESLALAANVRKLCMALPDVEEKLAWGEPTWRVAGRIFAQLDDHHHGAAHVSVWLATEPEAQRALIDAEPERFFRPPYVGHAGWVAAIVDGACDWGMVAAVIEQAYARIAAKGKVARSRTSRAKAAKPPATQAAKAAKPPAAQAAKAAKPPATQAAKAAKPPTAQAAKAAKPPTAKAAKAEAAKRLAAQAAKVVGAAKAR